MNELWQRLMQRAGLELGESTDALLVKYLELLSAGNRRMNLTRISEADGPLFQIADALTLLPQLPKSVHRLADIGSGGGVPGMVLAIARPDAQVVLMESTQKKAAFLKETAAAMELENVSVAALRAEEAGRWGMGGTFDVVTARAVAKLPELAKWMLPLARRGGVVLAMKGRRYTEEIPAAKKPIQAAGGGEITVIPSELPGADGHVILRVEKIR